MFKNLKFNIKQKKYPKEYLANFGEDDNFLKSHADEDLNEVLEDFFYFCQITKFLEFLENSILEEKNLFFRIVLKKSEYDLKKVNSIIPLFMFYSKLENNNIVVKNPYLDFKKNDIFFKNNLYLNYRFLEKNQKK